MGKFEFPSVNIMGDLRAGYMNRLSDWEAGVGPKDGDFSYCAGSHKFANDVVELLRAHAALTERCEKLERHAEAMAEHLNDGIQIDTDMTDGTQFPHSEWDFVANELIAAYRRDFPKDAP